MTFERRALSRRPGKSIPAAAARSGRVAQRSAIPAAIDTSPRAAAQRDVSARIQGSPYMIAQRARLGGAMGAVERAAKPTLQAKGIPVEGGLEREAHAIGGKEPSPSFGRTPAGGAIQKRDPGTYKLDQGALLTHGSAANVFDVDRKPVEGFSQTTDTDIPGGPAWMAQDNERFSVHAALVTQKYAELGEKQKKQLTVHTYKTDAMELHSWAEWKQVPEYLYRSLKRPAPSGYSPPKDMEERETYAFEFAKTKGSRFASNTTEAAQAIKSIARGDGYHLDKDLVRGEPEEILFESGLAKLKRDEKREFEVSWIQSPQKQLQVSPTGSVGGTYYWVPSDKKTLATTPIPKAGGGGIKCYLTTACVRQRGLADDCRELTVLRAFRDGYLSAQPHGPALIRDYYRRAPRLVRAISGSPNAHRIWEWIYRVIRGCVRDIERGRPELAEAAYRAMVAELLTAFPPRPTRAPVRAPRQVRQSHGF